MQRIENVRSTVNELAVMAPVSLTTRSNDALLTGKVKATFIDAEDLQVNAFKVVTERGIVYLMGRVTEREADARHRPGAHGQRRAEGGARVRDRHRAELAEAQPTERRRRKTCGPSTRSRGGRAQAVQRSRLIRLDVSQREPPRACTSP